MTLTAVVLQVFLLEPLAWTEDFSTGVRAQIIPVQHSVLSAQMAGKICVVAVEEGERFEKGELLLRFDDSMEQAELAKALAQLQIARKQLAVQERLAELGSSSSLEVEVAQAKVEELDAELSIAQLRVNYCRIWAPFDGRVAELYVQPFQAVEEMQSLMRIVNPARLEVKLLVPSQWVDMLPPGSGFTVEVEETGEACDAKVVRIGPWIDAVSRSVSVYGRLVGDCEGLRPGMSGYARFQGFSGQILGTVPGMDREVDR